MVLDFRLEVMKIGLQRSALLVVVNFPICQENVLDPKVENINGLIVLCRGPGLRDIAAAILVANEMNHGVLNNNSVQVYFALQCRHDLDIDGQLIDCK